MKLQQQQKHKAIDASDSYVNKSHNYNWNADLQTLPHKCTYKHAYILKCMCVVRKKVPLQNFAIDLQKFLWVRVAITHNFVAGYGCIWSNACEC